MREVYVRQLEELREGLLRMGSMVEHALTQAVKSLETWDTTIAGQVISNDIQIDELWRDTELRSYRLLATQQPIVGRDLRFMITVISVASELERIGDYANRIAKRARRSARRAVMVPAPSQVHELYTLALNMLHQSIDALVRQDIELAHSLTQADERIDQLVDTLREELLALARVDGQKVDAVIDLIEVIEALERTADRSTNIGERVIYLVTNDLETLN